MDEVKGLSNLNLECVRKCLKISSLRECSWIDHSILASESIGQCLKNGIYTTQAAIMILSSCIILCKRRTNHDKLHDLGFPSIPSPASGSSGTPSPILTPGPPAGSVRLAT